ncbi:NAD kinase [Convivina intestini]|uniref:NAD kinase n=1 Tax=Convivina intestini TaxID=1505726 RepID=A0A2U1DCB5_9LACO|nr:NAD kinase [Convivina intestini]PVY85300.1 NAD+ kinase [Convivina intestini]CAH1852792.1 NAD kinase [Convivina intestini]SDB86560.1 NAD+ kinase [Leuconostocaceae bacterium R-53105]
MKIAIYHNDLTKSQGIVNHLKQAIAERGLILDNQNPDVVISVGGDGTLLGAFHHYIDLPQEVRFVGLHTGHLGFYTDWLGSEVPELVDSLVHDSGQKVAYPILQMQTQHQDGSIKTYLALNEATVKQPVGTLVADICLGSQTFELFRGDGVAVSTPTGSTAYNKANGGAVLHPDLAAIQMSEIASINNRVFRTLGSPLIVPRGQTIRVKPRSNRFLITCDQLEIVAKNVVSVEFQVADKQVYFASYRHLDFWKRVQNAFIRGN